MKTQVISLLIDEKTIEQSNVVYSGDVALICLPEDLYEMIVNSSQAAKCLYSELKLTATNIIIYPFKKLGFN